MRLRQYREYKTYPKLRVLRTEPEPKQNPFNGFITLIFIAVIIASVYFQSDEQTENEPLEKFVETVLKDSTGKKDRFIIGEIPKEIISEIGTFATKSIKGFKYSITADDIRHIQRKHGVGNEKQKNQRGVKLKDYQHIIKTLYTPDKITQSEILKSGANTVKFKKNEYTLLAAISNRKKTITVLTFYIKTKP